RLPMRRLRPDRSPDLARRLDVGPGRNPGRAVFIEQRANPSSHPGALAALRPSTFAHVSEARCANRSPGGVSRGCGRTCALWMTDCPAVGVAAILRPEVLRARAATETLRARP